MTKKYLVLLVSALVSGPALSIGRGDDCKNIQDSRQRLQCYDEKSSNNSKNAELEKRKTEASSKAKEVLLALLRLKSRIEVGVNYRQYPEVLGEVKFQVDSSEQDLKEFYPEFHKKTLEIIAMHQDALSAWGQKFGYRGINDFMDDDSFYREKYPGLVGTGYVRGRLLIDAARAYIWTLANQETDNAKNILENEAKGKAKEDAVNAYFPGLTST